LDGLVAWVALVSPQMTSTSSSMCITLDIFQVYQSTLSSALCPKNLYILVATPPIAKPHVIIIFSSAIETKD